jgi:hypothetical protein
MLAALSFLALHLQPQPIELFRGAAVASPRYWDVTDTFLDASEPDTVNGGSYTLLGGKGKTILIRFGDLNRVVGPHKRVVKATLYLTPSGGDVPVLKAAEHVLVPWGEGPRTVLTNLFMPPKEGTKPEAPKWAADYRQRRVGFAGWQAPGATGAEDGAPIATAHLGQASQVIAIEGLEQAVQSMLDDPAENFGFALFFSSESEFLSSKSPNGRPRLEIQTEDTAPATGPDLAVTYISRTPSAPRPGQDVTYTAHVRNAGDAAAKGFAVRWRIAERFEKPVDVSEALAPGSEATVSIQRKYEPSPEDHRLHALGLRVLPNGPDACSADKELDVYEDAVPVSVVVPSAAFKALQSANMLGSHSPEVWVQSQVSLWNETYAAGSRFSFAPEGALERIRVDSIRISDSNLAIEESSGQAILDPSPNPLTANLPFLRRLSQAVGMLDGSAMNVMPGRVQVPGSATRADADYFPGLMGYGDTRFDGAVPGAIPLPYGPITDQTLEHTYLEPTDLFSATDVAALNLHLTKRPSKPSDDLLPIRSAIILKAASLDGRPLPNADLLFFQSVNGSFPAGDPAFAAKTNESGMVVLHGRGSAGPFGDLSPDAGNAVFLVQAKLHGVVETGWLKAWQLTDAASRGAVTSEVRLNLPELPLDTGTNLASDRIITDSASDLPAKLAGLIGDTPDADVSLPDAPGSWVEIDLGRDRALGEVDLLTRSGNFWKQFDIMTYTTGQTPSEAVIWSRELDWGWTLSNRSDLVGDARSVAYRGPAQRFRYLRVVNRSGGPGTLAEIRVFGARVSG